MKAAISALTATLLVAATSAFAANGAGMITSEEEALLDFSFDGLYAAGFDQIEAVYGHDGVNLNMELCMVDQYGGQWHLILAEGSITGNRDMISDCDWALDGEYWDYNFHIDLTLRVGGSCCETGYTDGTASMNPWTAHGDTYWTGNCDSGPWPYDWVECD